MESYDFLRAVSALGLTLALIGLCAWAVQKFGRTQGLRLGKSATARLSVIEWRPLDGRHQLFLIKRDTVEHLLLLSPNGTPVVIERDIKPVAAPLDPVSPEAPPLPVGAANPPARS